MVQRRTNKGVIIDMEALLAQNSDEPAMGNMKVNAKGDVLGKNGEIIQTKETKEEFIFDVRKLLDANENIADVNLEQIVDMVHELAESYRY